MSASAAAGDGPLAPGGARLALRAERSRNRSPAALAEKGGGAAAEWPAPMSRVIHLAGKTSRLLPLPARPSTNWLASGGLV